MTEVRFYHLTRSTLDTALPQILTKALERDMRALVVTPSKEVTQHLNDVLWRFDEMSFLPHGTEKEGDADHQPIWISESLDNQNQAQLLTLVEGVEAEEIDSYEMVCYFFNGLDEEALGKARNYWKVLKEKNRDLSYWQQTDRGAWKQKM